MNSTKRNNIRARPKVRPLRIVSPVHKANRQMALHMTQQVDHLQLGPAECHMLAYIHVYGPCAIGELVRVFGFKKPTMTSMLDRLERRGLVTRSINPDDRRSFLVESTADGERIAVEARALVDKIDRAIQRRVTARDVEGFENVMRAIEGLTGVDVRRDGTTTKGSPERKK